MRPGIILLLLGKEFKRLFKNLPAMLVLGLMLIVTMLLVTSKKHADDEVAADAETAAVDKTCMIVYWEEDDWIKHLKDQAKNSKLPFSSIRNLPFKQVMEFEIENTRPVFPENSCILEIFKKQQGEKTVYQLDYWYSGADKARFFPIANWILLNSSWHTNDKVSFETRSGKIKVREKPQSKSAPERFGLDESDQLNLVSTMLIFTTVFFICCALFVSFTSQEKEQGVLQSLALTPAKISEILLAKYAFHMGIGMTFAIVITLIVNPAAMIVPAYWIAIFLTALGLVSVGSIIASITNSQTTAGLCMFVYILLNGVVLLLSKQFIAFYAIQVFMFEFYSFIFIFLSLGSYSEQLAMALHIGLWRMLLTVTLLFITSVFLFVRYSWRLR